MAPPWPEGLELAFESAYTLYGNPAVLAAEEAEQGCLERRQPRRVGLDPPVAVDPYPRLL